MPSRGDYLLFSCLAPSPLGDRSGRRLFEWPVEGGTTHLDALSQLSGSFTEKGLSGGGEETGGMSPPPEHPTTPTIQPVPPRTASSLSAVLRVVLICENIEVSNAGWWVGRLTLCAVTVARKDRPNKSPLETNDWCISGAISFIGHVSASVKDKLPPVPRLQVNISAHWSPIWQPIMEPINEALDVRRI
ncbi:hypothetical protein CPAR01_02230 [Colletotrichum paranaense]|uniref:Uncharacterized protein n=1 Tax=Colletotrichum paranaense TaxID=1914294 RepID=A0ABQ9SYW7_9PEZI|nr:uncharacterized protein CPAR01_02230 [Colletotrichum paranaense]KAK1544728.1 hypothetical protein CPAR01_02230 [Colletotrichum paranaense]